MLMIIIERAHRHVHLSFMECEKCQHLCAILVIYYSHSISLIYLLCVFLHLKFRGDLGLFRWMRVCCDGLLLLNLGWIWWWWWPHQKRTQKEQHRSAVLWEAEGWGGGIPIPEFLHQRKNVFGWFLPRADWWSFLPCLCPIRPCFEMCQQEAAARAGGLHPLHFLFKPAMSVALDDAGRQTRGQVLNIGWVGKICPFYVVNISNLCLQSLLIWDFKKINNNNKNR